MLKKLDWQYLGIFTVTHLMAYSGIAALFLLLQAELPDGQRAALEFFKPYQAITFSTLLVQAFRGLVLALVLYPFARVIRNGANSIWVIIGIVWGVVVVGSVQPMPGSIEGLIYTETTWLEHGMVLVASFCQAIIFAMLFGRLYIQKIGGKDHA